jgi:hypothetical protein
VSERFTEDHVTMLSGAFLEFLLQITTAVLVFTKSRDVASQILQAGAGKSIP